ncbi:hypothetical protein ZWY2020_011302 [Hordeum vulgare]|nr:hypothetical protein ZWY2020_011302 [Hordeum vulgare]
MEDPSSDSGQSANGAEPELDPMELYDNEESRSHTVDDSNGQSSMDVDRKQLSVDADMNGKPSLNGDGKGKYSESHAEVPIDMNLGSLERFCKEASRSFFDEVGLISHQINSYNEFVSHGLQELFDSLGEVFVEQVMIPQRKELLVVDASSGLAE